MRPAVPTRWATVAKLLTRRIAEGEYPVGAVLPSEVALAGQLGVSRATLRAALGELQRGGLISRRRNAGTRVEATRPLQGPESYDQTLATVEDVAQYGAETERQVQEIAVEPVDVELAALLGCPPGEAWLRVSSLRAARGAAAPLCWTDLYVAPAFAALVRARIGTYPGLVGTLIEEAGGQRTAEIRQRITAIGVPRRLAAALGARPGASALEITRAYCDAAGRRFLLSRSIHPSDRFAYESRLRRRPA